jgi:cytochrome c553
MFLKFHILPFALAACFSLPTWRAVAEPPQIPECSACHGVNGLGNDQSGFPALAGLASPYIQAQLDAFKQGSRASPMMTGIARSLSVADIQALGDYYAALAIPAQALPPARSGMGANLAGRGDWQGGLGNGVPSCNSCHGPNGIGVGTQFPRLAGQPQQYLVIQINDWRDGSRKTGPLGLMANVAHRLSAAQIDAVAAYYAGLPANPLPGGKP